MNPRDAVRELQETGLVRDDMLQQAGSLQEAAVREGILYWTVAAQSPERMRDMVLTMLHMGGLVPDPEYVLHPVPEALEFHRMKQKLMRIRSRYKTSHDSLLRLQDAVREFMDRVGLRSAKDEPLPASSIRYAWRYVRYAIEAYHCLPGRFYRTDLQRRMGISRDTAKKVLTMLMHMGFVRYVRPRNRRPYYIKMPCDRLEQKDSESESYSKP